MSDYTILIVDYDPGSLESLRAMLVARGHAVHVAKDGLAAIEAFKRIQPDLTLVEFMLPKKPGLEVCLELRSTPHGESTPIVIMSSRFRSRQYRNQAHIRFRADEFIEKPIDQEKLDAILHRHLQGKTTVEVLVESGDNFDENAVSEQELDESHSLAVGHDSPDAGLTGEINDRIDSLLGG